MYHTRAWVAGAYGLTDSTEYGVGNFNIRVSRDPVTNRHAARMHVMLHTQMSTGALEARYRLSIAISQSCI